MNREKVIVAVQRWPGRRVTARQPFATIVYWALERAVRSDDAQGQLGAGEAGKVGAGRERAGSGAELERGVGAIRIPT